METTNTLKNIKTVWVILIYFILCFYCFGISMMTYFVDYISLSKIHLNVLPVMSIFKNRMILACYIPNIFLIFSSIALYYFRPRIFPQSAIISAIILSITATIATIFFILPIHNALPNTGLTASIENKLYPISFYFQVILGAIQILIALLLLNKLYTDIKTVSRFFFIIVVGLTFYSMGTSVIEAYINYPLWTKISETDWLGFRFSDNKFLQVFLLPNFLSLLLIIPLFWKRPKGIPKFYILTFLLAQLYIFVVTAIYFVPKIQIPLNTKFSLLLIEDLSRYDLILRVPAILFLLFITSKMIIESTKLKLGKIEK